jgi:hypothetical protein
MTYDFRGYKGFHDIARIEINDKGADILLRLLWHFHVPFLPGTWYTLILSPPDTDFHTFMPLERYGHAAYELSTARVRFNAVSVITIDRERGYSTIRIV